MIKCGCDKSKRGTAKFPGIEKNIDTNNIGGNNIDYKIKYRDKSKRGTAKFVPRLRKFLTRRIST